MSDDDFKTLTSSTDPALIVVTTVAEDERAGCLVGFHCAVQHRPAPLRVWLSKANHTYRVALRAQHFAVHLLTSATTRSPSRSARETGDDVDKFAGCDVDHDGTASRCSSRAQPDVAGARTLLDDGSDHVCLTTRVTGSETAGSFVPLRLSAAEHLDPGHEAEERAIRP